MLQNGKWPRAKRGHYNSQRRLIHSHDEIEGFNEEAATQGVKLNM